MLKQNDRVKLKKATHMTGTIVSVKGNNVEVKWDNIEETAINNYQVLIKIEEDEPKTISTRTSSNNK